MTIARNILALTAIAGMAAPALAIDLVYFEENGGGANPRGLYNFDPTTGISTLRTTVGGTDRLFGLHVRPGTSTVYAVGVATQSLYTIDIDTGALTLVGSIAITGGSAPIADIAFDPTTDILYGMARNSPYGFYTINPASGGTSFLYNTSDGLRCGMVISPAGTFYAFSIDGILSTFNSTTGAATLVGGSSIGGSVVEDAVYASDGSIYFTVFDGRIYRVDPVTGANTLVGNSGMGSGLNGIIEVPVVTTCYANCDGSTQEPILNVADFSCFLSKFAAADPYANCDGSTTPPVHNVADFSCFLGKFAAGCN
jgi:hypothetical protein